jgi:uncharacterized membrane protein YfcA
MKKAKKIISVPIGLVVGFANGLFGAGGGTLLVPALQKWMGKEAHKAHATALIVMLPLSIVSAIIYIWGVDVEWAKVGLVSAGGVVGGVVGAKVLKKLTAGWLHIIFGAALLAGAVRMLFA